MFYSKKSNISLILFNKISASGILYVLKWTAFVLHVLKIETKEYSQDINSNNVVVHNQLSFFKNKITNYLWSPNSTKSWTSQIWHPQQIADKETFAHLERFWFFFVVWFLWMQLFIISLVNSSGFFPPSISLLEKYNPLQDCFQYTYWI